MLFAGAVGEHVASVELRFQDGDVVELPTAEGYVLGELPARHCPLRHRLDLAVARDAAGVEVGRKIFDPTSRSVYPCAREDQIDLGLPRQDMPVRSRNTSAWGTQTRSTERFNAAVAVVTTLLALAMIAALAAAPTASAKTKPCADEVVADWYGDGRVDPIYPRHCYRRRSARCRWTRSTTRMRRRTSSARSFTPIRESRTLALPGGQRPTGTTQGPPDRRGP